MLTATETTKTVASHRSAAPSPGLPQLEKALRDMLSVVRPLLDDTMTVGDLMRRLGTLAVAVDAAQSVLDARARTQRMFVVEVANRAGPYISETPALDRETLVKDLAGGQWNAPVRVLEVTDASREFAAAVAEHSDVEQVEPPRDVTAWCERFGAEPYRKPAEPDPDDLRDAWLERKWAEVAR